MAAEHSSIRNFGQQLEHGLEGFVFADPGFDSDVEAGEFSEWFKRLYTSNIRAGEQCAWFECAQARCEGV